jgi:hypothetical protein
LLASGGFSTPIASRRRGRASCRPAPARSNNARLDFYDRLVDGLIARGITPWLCLYHWDLPQALQDQAAGSTAISPTNSPTTRASWRGGSGDRVKHWAMFNEPNIHALFGYGVGDHAPGPDRPAEHAGRDASPESGARPRGAGAARGTRRPSPRHGARLRRRGRPPIATRIAAPPSGSTRVERRLSRSAVQGRLSGGWSPTTPRAADRRRRSASDSAADRFPGLNYYGPMPMSPMRRKACSARGSAPCRPARALPRSAGRSTPAGSPKTLIRLRDATAIRKST